ncbi:MAG: ATPase P [candidate division Zixibacteria bacterium]|nr:ATPase P [candidate division Zixibacteria bacterium]
MKDIKIPGYGPVRLRHLVCDFSGTLSVDGILIDGVREKLNEIAETYEIHILTADTHGRAAKQLEGVKCEINFLDRDYQDVQKELYTLMLGADLVIALGNGINDRKMLRSARIGIAVCLAEGLSIEAMKMADIIVTSPVDALDLVLNPNRLIATLRN